LHASGRAVECTTQEDDGTCVERPRIGTAVPLIRGGHCAPVATHDPSGRRGLTYHYHSLYQIDGSSHSKYVLRAS
jgi:hypothetical protein